MKVASVSFRDRDQSTRALGIEDVSHEDLSGRERAEKGDEETRRMHSFSHEDNGRRIT